MPEADRAAAVGGEQDARRRTRRVGFGRRAIMRRRSWAAAAATVGVAYAPVRTLAFVQARMGSTRLPGKVLAPVAGRAVLARIVERLARSRARRRGRADLDVHARRSDRRVLRSRGVALFRGDEVDVLDRYQQAASALGPDRIVRITADCPLVDPEVVAAVLALAGAPGGGDCRYASVATGAVPGSAGYRRFPDGLDAEAFTAGALAEAWGKATTRSSASTSRRFCGAAPSASAPASSRPTRTSATSAGRSTIRPTSISSGTSTSGSATGRSAIATSSRRSSRPRAARAQRAPPGPFGLIPKNAGSLGVPRDRKRLRQLRGPYRAWCRHGGAHGSVS